MEPKFSAERRLISQFFDLRWPLSLASTDVLKIKSVAISPSSSIWSSFRMRIKITSSFSRTSFSTSILKISVSITDWMPKVNSAKLIRQLYAFYRIWVTLSSKSVETWGKILLFTRIYRPNRVLAMLQSALEANSLITLSCSLQAFTISIKIGVFSDSLILSA